VCVWVCVCVGFVTCGCVYVCGGGLQFVCVCVCVCVGFITCDFVCGFCNVWVYVCVGFVMCGCMYLWLL